MVVKFDAGLRPELPTIVGASSPSDYILMQVKVRSTIDWISNHLFSGSS